MPRKPKQPRWIVSFLIDARDGSSLKEKDELPSCNQLKVRKLIPAKDRKPPDPDRTMLEIEGTLSGTQAWVWKTAVVAALNHSHPDGFVFMEIEQLD